MKSDRLTVADPVSMLAPGALVAALVATASTGLVAGSALAEPFKLGASDSTVLPSNGGYDYPAPQAVIPQRPLQGAAQSSALHGNVQRERPAPPPPRPPLQSGVQKQVQLPPGYLGVWQVQGRRTTVDAKPEFMAAAQQFMAASTSNTWQITGSPGNYQMGNGQMSTPLIVDRVDANGTAYIRYQHPVIKTMAQEAIVLSLAPGGMQFSGLERVSIIKEGEPQPRAKVTYELMGQRQR